MNQHSTKTRFGALALESSNHDRTNALMWSSNIVVGTLAVVLFLTWLSAMLTPPSIEIFPTPVIPIDQQLELSSEPMSMAVAEIIQPDELPEAATEDFSKTLASIPHAVKTGAEQIGSIGDSLLPRQPGPTPGASFTNRWNVEITANSFAEYCQIIDELQIEIGIVDPISNKITRINNISRSGGAKPNVHQSTRENEKTSIYFTHRNARLRSWDQRVATATGIHVQNAIWVQFYPPGLIQRMHQLEVEYAAQSSKVVDDIRQTSFGICSGCSADVIASNVVNIHIANIEFIE